MFLTPKNSMRNLIFGNTKTERSIFGIEASSVWQTNSGSAVTRDGQKSHQSGTILNIGITPGWCPGRGGETRRRCGNQAPGHQLLQSVTHWTIVTEHGTNARCHGPGWPPSHKTCSEEQSHCYQQDPARTGEFRPR